jgi:hypothetical protein
MEHYTTYTLLFVLLFCLYSSLTMLTTTLTIPGVDRCATTSLAEDALRERRDYGPTYVTWKGWTPFVVVCEAEGK